MEMGEFALKKCLSFTNDPFRSVYFQSFRKQIEIVYFQNYRSFSIYFVRFQIVCSLTFLNEQI